MDEDRIKITCPIKVIKTFTITLVSSVDKVTPVPFPGCTPTLTLKDDYADTTKTMTLIGTVGGTNNNVLSFTTTVAGTTVTPGKYKGDVLITNGTNIHNRDLQIDWIFTPIVGD